MADKTNKRPREQSFITKCYLLGYNFGQVFG